MISNPTVTEVVAAIQDVAAALAGMRSAPDAPPEQAGAFPFAVTYASGVESVRDRYSANPVTWTFTTEIHVQRRDMARDVSQVTPIASAFLAALTTELEQAAQVQIDSVQAVFGGSEWGGIETRAWVFTTRVRMNRSI